MKFIIVYHRDTSLSYLAWLFYHNILPKHALQVNIFQKCTHTLYFIERPRFPRWLQQPDNIAMCLFYTSLFPELSVLIFRRRVSGKGFSSFYNSLWYLLRPWSQSISLSSSPAFNDTTEIVPWIIINATTLTKRKKSYFWPLETQFEL